MSLTTRYNSLLYAARATTSTFHKLKDWHARKKGNTHGPRVSTVRQRTRGALASHKTAFAKDRLAGIKRRNDLAKTLKAKRALPINRVARTHQGPTVKKNPIIRKPYPAKIQLREGMTGRDLKRKVIRHAIKTFTAEQVKGAKGNRREAAAHIKAMRSSGKVGGGVNYATHIVRHHAKYFAKQAAAAFAARRKKKP